ncbi:MAG: 50S ribosomal protein L11 methyltransferase [Clostridiales bacterium]|nr:50S ribosomal protein L11 methyltransferase [Clostridiales bacterium]
MNYTEWIIYTEKPEDLEAVETVLIMNDIYDSVVNDPRDVQDLLNKKNEYDWDYVDESVLELENERPSVVLYVYEDSEIKDSIADIIEEVKNTVNGVEVVVNEANDDEWKDKWKEYFKPAKITDKLVVKPTWEEYEAKEGELVIEIDPGMAFGTGTHETTSLCLELIEKYIKEGDTLLDVGCGSGILAIAAGLLGASDVLGIEIDPVAVEIGNENVALNKLSDKISVIYGDLTKGVDYKADIVAANLMADLVKMLSPSVPAHLKEGGIYISSGILAVLAEEVSAVIEESGFEIVEIMVKGEWCAIAARQK